MGRQSETIAACCRLLPPIAAAVAISYVSIPHDPKRAGADMNRGGPPGPPGGGGGGKRERRWQTSQERARVAAELIEEAESLTQTGAIASPNDVARDQQPPPLRIAQHAGTPGPADIKAKLDDGDHSEPPPPPAPPPAPPTAAEPPSPTAPDAPPYVAAREASERGERERAT